MQHGTVQQPCLQSLIHANLLLNIYTTYNSAVARKLCKMVRILRTCPLSTLRLGNSGQECKIYDKTFTNCEVLTVRWERCAYLCTLQLACVAAN